MKIILKSNFFFTKKLVIDFLNRRSNSKSHPPLTNIFFWEFSAYDLLVYKYLNSLRLGA